MKRGPTEQELFMSWIATCTNDGCDRKAIKDGNLCYLCALSRNKEKIKIIKKGGASPEGYTWIYVLQGEDDGLIKIGKAKNLRARFGSIQSSSPVVIRLLCAFLAKDKVEKDLHEYFSDLRVRGEWFKPEESIKLFAANIEDSIIPCWLEGTLKNKKGELHRIKGLTFMSQRDTNKGHNGEDCT